MYASYPSYPSYPSHHAPSHARCDCRDHAGYARPGVAGLLGGALELSAAVLWGGARLVRTGVDRALWYGSPDWGCACGECAELPAGCPPDPCARHCYHVQYVPCVYTCGPCG